MTHGHRLRPPDAQDELSVQSACALKFTASFAAQKALGDLAARRSPSLYGPKRQNPGHSSLGPERNALFSTRG